MTFDVRNVPGILAVLMCFAFAVWLWRIGGRRSTTRQLSALLVIEGVALATSGAVAFGLTIPHNSDGLPTAWFLAGHVLHHAADVALIALYPPFLASVLRTRWTVPCGKASIRIALAVLALALFAFVFSFFTNWIALGFSRGSLANNENYFNRVWVLYLAMCLLVFYAFAVSLHAWWTATTAIEQRRARAFAIGFGIRDVCWAVSFGSLSYLNWISPGPQPGPAPNLIYAIGTLIEVPLIAYGILSTQLFDIDLKVKWTIRQSTLAAMVIAIIYFATEAADRLLSHQLGPWPGLVAAALIVYFLAPLQRLAERFANRAMPETVNSPEYRAFRKLQVYEAALAEALRGEDISAKERAILASLRESLGVSADDARSIENDLRERLAPRGLGPAEP